MLFKNAPWNKIREAVERQKEVGFPTKDVEQMMSWLMIWANCALEAYCPQARPSPYMKQWWNEDLMVLRKSYIYWRNWACMMWRQGREDVELCNTVIQAKKLFHRTIRWYRKLYWEVFLDDSDNI